jgi:hypothetical protein
MTELAGLRTRILQVLGDTSGVRYAEGLLDESLRQALHEYSLAWPQVKTAALTVTVAGREQSLASLTGFQTVLEVIYPYDASDDDPDPTGQFYCYWLQGVPMLQLTGRQVPAVGEKIRVTYSALHTIKDLDSATVTSVRTDHENLLVTGAAGQAATTRSATVVEGYTNKSSSGPLLEWGSQKLMAFRSGLATLRQQTAPPRPFTGWPDRGWAMDAWDEREHGE